MASEEPRKPIALKSPSSIDLIFAKLLGQENFMNLHDLMFFNAHKEKEILKPHHEYLETVKWKVYASALIFPVSIIINNFVQTRYPNVFIKRRFFGYLFDLAYYSGALLLTLGVASTSAKEQKFQSLKRLLIENEILSYLYLLGQNEKMYNIPLDLQLKSQNYNLIEIDEVKKKVNKAVERMKTLERTQGQNI